MPKGHRNAESETDGMVYFSPGPSFVAGNTLAMSIVITYLHATLVKRNCPHKIGGHEMYVRSLNYCEQ